MDRPYENSLALVGKPKPMCVSTTALVTNRPAYFKWGSESSLVWVTALDTGKPVAAPEEVLLAHTLDPVSSIIMRDIAMIHYYRRDFESALDQCDGTLEQDPHSSACYWFLGLVQEQRGDCDESAAASQRAIQLSPYSPQMRAGLGRTFALSGRRGDALEILRYLEDLAKTRYVSPFDIASLHFALHQKDSGFECLATAFKDRSFDLISIQVDPRFDSSGTIRDFFHSPPTSGCRRKAAVSNQHRQSRLNPGSTAARRSPKNHATS